MPLRQRENFPLAIVTRLYSVNAPPDEKGGCYLYVPPAWTSIIFGLLGLLTQKHIWAGDESEVEKQVQWAIELIDGYICQLPKETVETVKTRIVDGFSFEDIEDYLEDYDMCNCIKNLDEYIRVSNGNLQIFVARSCASEGQWKTIGALSSAPIDNETISGSDGFGTDFDDLPDVEGIVGENQDAQIRCYKATAVVNMLWDMETTGVEAAQGATGFPTVLWNALTATVAFLTNYAGFPMIAGTVTAIQHLVNITHLAVDEYADWLADDANRINLICAITPKLSNKTNLTSADILAIKTEIEGLELTFTGSLAALWGILTPATVNTYIQAKIGEQECDCAAAIPQPPQSETEPETAYTWCRVFDFTISQYGVALSAIDGGAYEAGVGIKGTYVSWGNGASYGIGANKNTGGAANVTSMDVFYDYATTSENPANPQNDNNKMTIKVPAGSVQAIVPKNQWSQGFYRWEGNKTGVGVEVQWFAGWDGSLPNDISGHIHIKKIIIRGVGTDTFLSLPAGERGVLCGS